MTRYLRGFDSLIAYQMISDLRRMNDADNPFEAWELYIDGVRYYYTTNPEDETSYKSYKLPASTRLVRAIEDEDGIEITVTRWTLKGVHLPMNLDNFQQCVLRVLLVGEKSVSRELNGCI